MPESLSPVRARARNRNRASGFGFGISNFEFPARNAGFGFRISNLRFLLCALCVSAVQILLLSSCSHFNQSPEPPAPVSLSSPGANVTATLTPSTTATLPLLDISWRGQPVLSADLGLALDPDLTLGPGMAVESIETDARDATWTWDFGPRSRIRDHYRSAAVHLADPADPAGRRLTIDFRLYDDGLAFRYRIPEQPSITSLNLRRELTALRFPAAPQAWALPLKSFTTSFEANYTSGPLTSLPADTLFTLPLLLQTTSGAWAAVTEAHLDDWAGLYLSRDSAAPDRLSAVLAPLPDAPDLAVRRALPAASPWRVIMLGDQPGRLVESDIVLNLNPPATGDFSWVKPGLCAWDWWSGHVVDPPAPGADPSAKAVPPMTAAMLRHYIDFAAANGFPYMLVDAGWYGNHRDPNGDITAYLPDIDIPALARYARDRNVDLILWINWAAADRQMDTAFPLYASWGIKGVKIDYMDSDHQPTVNFYQRATATAARHHLLVDFHGAYKPTGLRRTFPNLITREGVLGAEANKWSRNVTTEHNTTIPFTRLLAGPMDYTPGGFSNAQPADFTPRYLAPMTQGTRAHQLALFVILESPLQMVSDFPANYDRGVGLDFIRQVPTVWDETRVLAGHPGDYALFARRKGETWYLAAITDATPRNVKIPLAFLARGQFNATLWLDGPDAATEAESAIRADNANPVTAAATLTLDLAPNGGAVVILRPESATQR